jgi:hypothetical protein
MLDDPQPPFAPGHAYGEPSLIFAACPWAATSYTVTVALLAIRRSLRRHCEIRALERAFAREQSTRPFGGRRTAR